MILEIRAMDIQEIKLDGLSSLKCLKLEIYSIKQVELGNLLALREFELKNSRNAISSDILDEFLNSSPNIEYLNLVGTFSYFSLNSLLRLKKLRLYGTLNTEEFNFDLFKYLSIQLTSLNIQIDNIDDKIIAKLFYDLQFPNLTELRIKSTKITKLEKKLFDGFANLEFLEICFNELLKTIDHDAFSSLKQLRDLDLCCNCIESLGKKHLSKLINLETLKLNRNEIKTIEDYMFSKLKKLTTLNYLHNQVENVNRKSFAGLRNLKELNLSCNKLEDFDLRILDNIKEIENIDLNENKIYNKDELSSRFKDSKIIFSI